MTILTVAFAVLLLLVVGSAWVRLRSNWKSIQAMRAGHKGVGDSGLFSPDGADLPDHLAHGHEAVHHDCHSADHHYGDSGGDHGWFDGGGGHH